MMEVRQPSDSRKVGRASQALARSGMGANLVGGQGEMALTEEGMPVQCEAGQADAVGIL